MSWDQLRASYDRVAPRYERTFLHELDGKPRDRELLATFVAALTDPVLDVGCGPGHVGGFFRDRGRHVIGMDNSAAMARLAAAHLGSAAVAHMRHLPARDGVAGGLVAFYSVIHLRRRELAGVFREFRRVLQPGGRLLVSAHRGTGELAPQEFLGEQVPFVATLYDMRELSDAAEAAGLDMVIAERRAPYPSEHPTNRLYLEALRGSRR